MENQWPIIPFGCDLIRLLNLKSNQMRMIQYLWVIVGLSYSEIDNFHFSNVDKYFDAFFLEIFAMQ